MAAVLVGLVNGIGVGVFRVHPLIMTLGIGLVVLGLAAVYQRRWSDRRRGPGRAPVARLGHDLRLPAQQPAVFVPLAALIILGLRRPATAGCCTPSATTRSPRAWRASRSWQVLVVAVRHLGLLAAHRRLPRLGPHQDRQRRRSPTPYLLPSVAAAVIGGTSIFGGRGGYAGTIVGALILTVLTAC